MTPASRRPATAAPVIRFSKSAAWVLVFFLAAAALQWKNAVYRSSFGFHPDEPAHYVTGLMVYKYVTGGIPSNPMAFAERFYAHYPAVAFGHWPPAFYVLQAGWEMAFGSSRLSVLLLLALLAAVISKLLYDVLSPRYGRLTGASLALLFLAVPIVQQHTGSVMAEIPLTLFTFTTALSLSALMRSPTKGRAFVFGVSLALAILTKGDGWALIALPFAAAFLSGQYRSAFRRHIIVPMLAVFACCLPVTLATLRMTRDGWDQQTPSVQFFMHAMPSLARFHLMILGVPLAVLACVGVFAAVIRPRFRGRAVDSTLVCHAALVGIVLLFHAVAPTSLEARKLFMSIPSLIVLAAAGLESLTETLRSRGHASVLPRACTAAIPGMIALGFVWQPAFRPHADMRSAARQIAGQRALDRTAVLVAAEALDEREELSFVAEMADVEHANYNHAVIRAGKFMADSSWSGSGYRLSYAGAQSAGAALNRIPVSAIILSRTGNEAATPHSHLVEEVIAADPDRWGLEMSYADPLRVELFCARMRAQKDVELPAANLRRKLDRSFASAF